MNKKQNTFEFSRKIKLGPAIGDWTTVQMRDDLLEEVQIATVKNVSFDAFPRETLTYVHYMHYRIAQDIAKKLSDDMNIKLELHSIEAKQLSYGDFLSLQKDKVVQADFVVDGIGRINTTLEWGLAQRVVNRLSGGVGEEYKSDVFSEIELKILETQIFELKKQMVLAWKNVFSEDQIKLEFEAGDYVRDKKISLREAYVLFSFNLYFGKGNLKKIFFAYPSAVLRKLLYKRALVDDPIKHRVELDDPTVEKIKVFLKVVLGGTTLTMREVRQLQVGDVISLEETLNTPVRVVFSNDSVFYGQPGISANDKLSVQLLSVDQSCPETMPMEVSNFIPKESHVTDVSDKVDYESVNEPIEKEPEDAPDESFESEEQPEEVSSDEASESEEEPEEATSGEVSESEEEPEKPPSGDTSEPEVKSEEAPSDEASESEETLSDEASKSEVESEEAPSDETSESQVESEQAASDDTVASEVESDEAASDNTSASEEESEESEEAPSDETSESEVESEQAASDDTSASEEEPEEASSDEASESESGTDEEFSWDDLDEDL